MKGVRGPLIALLVLATASAARSAPEDWARAGHEALARARVLESRARAKNVVVFIGDGMGLTTVTAARILEGQLRGAPGEGGALAFESLPFVALTRTYNTNQQVPDSAGTITAVMTGVKTRAGVIGVDEGLLRGDHTGVEAHRLRTLFEDAEARGLATGIVTTTGVTHATPAGAYAHVPDRSWQSDADLPPAARRAGFPDIARQLVEFPHGDGLDVVLGGGRAGFRPAGAPDPEDPRHPGVRLDGRDLTAEWVAGRPGAAYVWNLAGLQAVDPEAVGPLLGLFEASHMHFEADRTQDVAGEPSLSQMTTVAIDLLARRDEGFVLLVEGGRIDHAHHLGNAYHALTETIEFARAVGAALAVIDLTETLVLVTADHGHVLTIAGYPTRGNPILGKVIENDARGKPASDYARDAFGLPYTTLGYQNGPGYFRRPSETHEYGDHAVAEEARREERAPRGRPDLTGVDTTAPDFRPEATVPLRAETHSGEDVPVYAGGPGAQWIHGVQEQSYLYYVIVEALGWNDRPTLLQRLFR